MATVGSDVTAAVELEPGSVVLDRWFLHREIGRGGFGAVFEVEDRLLGQRQALKVLDPSMAARTELLERFKREVLVMRQVAHSRIVQVYEYGEDRSRNLAVIGMEYVDGGSVRDLLGRARKRGEQVPIRLATTILAQVLEGLAHAHEKGIIHRDVTPGNVLLAESPRALLKDPDLDPGARLVDFGIAGMVDRSELSQKSRVLGTAAYVAPEVLDPQAEITVAADIYGAGALGYELLTGELPTGRFEDPSELRPDVGSDLEEVLLELLSRRPDRRQAAGEAAEAFRELCRAGAAQGAVPAAFPPAEEPGSAAVELPERLVLTAPGTAVDPKTGLIWTAKDNGEGIDWHGAKEYADNLSLGGFSDWRLPTIDELEGLYETDTGEQNCRLGIELSSPWTWSGSMEGSSRAWFFNFHLGYRFVGLRVFDGYRVLCVRGPRA